MGESMSKWQNDQPPPGTQQEFAIDLSKSSDTKKSQSDQSYAKPELNLTSPVSFKTAMAHRGNVPHAHSHGCQLARLHNHMLDLASKEPTQSCLNLTNHSRDSSNESTHSTARQVSNGEVLSTASLTSADVQSASHDQSTASDMPNNSQSVAASRLSPPRNESPILSECESSQSSSSKSPHEVNYASAAQVSLPADFLELSNSVIGDVARNNLSLPQPFLGGHLSESSSSIDFTINRPPGWLAFPHVAPYDALEGIRRLVQTQGSEQASSTHSSTPMQLLANFSRHQVPLPAGVESMEEEEDEEEDTNTTRSNLESIFDSSKKRRTNKRKKGKLWEFLLDLLLSKDMNPSVVKWEDERRMVFKITNPKFVAELWGQRKSNPNMTFEKLSRAMRHYYKLNILLKVDGGPHLYQFGDLTEA